MAPFDGKCKHLQMSAIKFFAGSYRFRDINIRNLLPSKSRSRSRTAICPITPFDGKCKNLQMSPTHFCASSYTFRD